MLVFLKELLAKVVFKIKNQHASKKACMKDLTLRAPITTVTRKIEYVSCFIYGDN